MPPSSKNTKTVFITGATGYIGTRLVKRLVSNGYHVIALEIITGDPFDAHSFQQHIPPGSVFLQLLGVAHPSPKKAQEFRAIDLRSVKASAEAASHAGTSHFIYVSVAMTPSKLMHAYQQARREGETFCLEKKLHCTFIRPWYVVGPGHWWPLLLLPFYGLAELVPSWRKKAKAMGLVSIRQMLSALEKTVAAGSSSPRVIEVKDIRRGIQEHGMQEHAIQEHG